MNSQEIKDNYDLASKQFEIRVARLKQHYKNNAPHQIIDAEFKLIKEAGKRILLYSLPYEKMLLELPAAKGAEMIRDVERSYDFEQFNIQIDNQWNEFATDLKTKLPNKTHGIIDQILLLVKEKTVLLPQ